MNDAAMLYVHEETGEEPRRHSHTSPLGKKSYSPRHERRRATHAQNRNGIHRRRDKRNYL